MCIAFISWLDAHAGAITALATVVLVLITVAYVVVTYLLVREQRLQGHMPEMIHEWANVDDPDADLRLQNVGSGTAAGTTIILGPGDGVRVDMPMLGDGKSLLSGEDLVWPIRPADGNKNFADGNLPLTLRFFDNNHSKAFFNVLLLEFELADGSPQVRSPGSVARNFTKRELRALTRHSLKPWQWPRFQWRTRTFSLSVLLLETEVRDALRASLAESLENLGTWSQRSQSFGRRI